MPNGIFLTHAHIGHYTGLMYLGKEAHNSRKIPVYCLPRMKKFLENNGAWNQLSAVNNIQVFDIEKTPFNRENISISAIKVPHRDEFSETAAFIIGDENKRAIFIPDIDKWSKWNVKVDSMVNEVDYAFLDATFYDGKELPERDMSEIPHPFVVETELEIMDAMLRKKVILIHFNHSNPLIFNPETKSEIESKGFKVAALGQIY